MVRRVEVEIFGDSAYRGAGMPATWKTMGDLKEKYAGGTCKSSKL